MWILLKKLVYKFHPVELMIFYKQGFIPMYKEGWED